MLTPERQKLKDTLEKMKLEGLKYMHLSYNPDIDWSYVDLEELAGEVNRMLEAKGTPLVFNDSRRLKELEKRETDRSWEEDQRGHHRMGL
jgi:hypothetical protein